MCSQAVYYQCVITSYSIHYTKLYDAEIGATTSTFGYDESMERYLRATSRADVADAANTVKDCLNADAEVYVITSYSIHYTKLYEGIDQHKPVFTFRWGVSRCGTAGQGGVDGGKFDEVLNFDKFTIVITSYSIHYTKLYEGIAKNACFGNGNG